jgi:hypothetical protein
MELPQMEQVLLVEVQTPMGRQVPLTALAAAVAAAHLVWPVTGVLGGAALEEEVGALPHTERPGLAELVVPGLFV